MLSPEDHPQYEGDAQAPGAIGARVNQLSQRADSIERDSRMDNLVRQSDEINKIASIVSARAFQLFERLDGQRPDKTSNKTETPAPSNGYLMQLQDNFQSTRMFLESLQETLNELDGLI